MKRSFVLALIFSAMLVFVAGGLSGCGRNNNTKPERNIETWYNWGNV